MTTPTPEAIEAVAVEAAMLPTLPGMVRGVVAVRLNEKGHNQYTLQCENCFALETPSILSQMKTHFHRRGEDRRRLCRSCRSALFRECTCAHCRTDRNESEFS